jgi:fused signal recognition particle receptor
MEKRPGLLKRIFSFGFGSRKAEIEQEPESESQRDAPAETPLPPPVPETAERARPPAQAETTEAPPADLQDTPDPAAKIHEPAGPPEALEPPAAAAASAEPASELHSEPQPSPRETDSEVKAKRRSRKIPAPPKPKPVKVTKPSPQPAPESQTQESGKSRQTAVRPMPPALPAAPEISAPETQATNESAAAPKDETAAMPPSGTLEPEQLVEAVEQTRSEGWFRRLRKGLTRSSDALVGNVAAIFTKRRLDEATLQELEDVLIQADLGIEAAMAITDALSAKRLGREVTDREIRQVMAEEIEKVLAPVALPLELDLTARPHVILVVGVNGSGKTTTIGKLAAKLRGAGYSTMLVAGDTFRAAAIEQLSIWGERTGSPVVARRLGADAAGLAFDAYRQAAAEGCDVLIMDTAGRLQNKKELMAELEKIVRVLKKQDTDAPHTVLLTLDATTGQNALSQVEIFKDVAGVNGLVMTKLDGTARGGILVAIASKFRLPVFFIGVGEQVEDLEPFEARDFANSIAGLEPEVAAVETG